MKAEDIKVGNIYYIDFEPVRGKASREFGGKHMGIVLKKNRDKITFIVIPMTSNEDGDNKVNIGKIDSLPSNLRNVDSFVLLDQIRTLTSSRFYNMKDAGKIIESKVDENVLNNIIEKIFEDMLFDISSENKVKIIKELSDKFIDKSIKDDNM